MAVFIQQVCLSGLTILRVHLSGAKSVNYAILVSNFQMCVVIHQATFSHFLFVESLLLPETSLISSIPSEVGLLTNLVELHLYSNGLTGEIPVELASLEKAEQILLHVNELEGTVPEQVCDLPELEAISVSCGLSVGPECDCCVECANI